MASSFYPPQRTLMGPGPSEIHPRVFSAMGRPTILDRPTITASSPARPTADSLSLAGYAAGLYKFTRKTGLHLEFDHFRDHPVKLPRYVTEHFCPKLSSEGYK